MTTIKLHPPKELPEEGISAVAFEAWRNQVLSFLEQELINSEFISGLYATWRAKNTATGGRRLGRLFNDDVDKVKLATKHSKDTDGGTAKEAAEAELLLKRNIQLTKCLQLVANLCQYSEQADVMNSSTSFDWIWDHLRKHYNIETKGSHFLDVASMQPTPGQKPAVFYKQFRCGFLNNLRKAGDEILYNGTKLSEDEKISPTFESAILMWALEKLEPRLPAKVQKDFGFRMEGNMTLIDLQTVILQAVPAMIEELNSDTELRAVQAEEDPIHPVHPAQLSAGGPRGGWRGAGAAGRFRGGRGGNRGSRQPFPGSRPTGQADTRKGCRVCRLAGKTEAVVNSHTMKTCFFFTPEDHADFASLSMDQVEDRDTGANSPYYDHGEED